MGVQIISNKTELAEDSRASFSAGYVKTLRGGNSPVEALFAEIMIKDKLIKALLIVEIELIF